MSTLPRQIKSADLVADGQRPEFTTLRTVLLDVPNVSGFVFGHIDVQHRDEEFREKLVHIIASHLEGLRADIMNDGNVPRRFEAMLVKLNADLNRVGGESRMPLKKLKAVIGAMTDNQVFLSGIGNAHVLFLHRSAERRYVVYELDQQFVTEEMTWEKPFVTVLDGEMQPGDVLYIGTRIPPHALSLGDLQDILITLPPAGALERAQQFVPANVRYGAVCFHVAEEEKSGPPKKANPIVSLASLEETKNRTADLLGEQSPDVGGKLRAIAEKLRKQLGAPGSRGAGSITRRILQLVIRATVALAGFAAAGAKWSWSAARNPKHGVGATLMHAGQQSKMFMEKARGTSLVTKGVIAVIILIAVALVATIFASSESRERAEEEIAYQTTVDRIEEKRVAAEAAVIYNNTKDAQELISQATALLASLPTSTDDQRTMVDRIESELATLLAKTRGIAMVAPTTIATTDATLTSFALVGDALYATDSTLTPYRLNELSKALEKVDVGQSTLTDVRVSVAEGTNLLGIDSAKRLGRASITNRTVNPITSGVNVLQSIEDVAMYNDSLYVLTASTQQIVKMRTQGLGYEGGTPWVLSLESDISNATAMAIDGEVFLFVDNKIVRLKSGRENAWDHAPIDPRATQVVDMWTSPETTSLYLLDAGEGRVIVLDKEKGHLVAQYVSESFKGAIGFAVRESENRILVATPHNVQSFTATHLLQ